MADYHTYVVVDCKCRQILLVTSSARKALRYLQKGIRVEVWSRNCRVNVLYESTRAEQGLMIDYYVGLEADYIRKKQEAAYERNTRKRRKGGV